MFQTTYCVKLQNAKERNWNYVTAEVENKKICVFCVFGVERRDSPGLSLKNLKQ